MAIDATSARPMSNNEAARQRDAGLFWLLERHPATANMLTAIGLFPSKRKARKRLYRLVQRKQLRLLGTVTLTTGRPEHVYGRGRWKTDNLLHEVQLTRVCLKTHAGDIQRGPGQVDDYLRPDAELLIGGERYYLEMDCGTMSSREVVQSRFSRYQSSQHLVLWVCQSERRMQALRREASVIRDVALFTTLDLALRDPHAPIWIDADGGRAALPRHPQVGPNSGAVSELSPGPQVGP
jgi:hypothetical protein